MSSRSFWDSIPSCPKALRDGKLEIPHSSTNLSAPYWPTHPLLTPSRLLLKIGSKKNHSINIPELARSLSSAYSSIFGNLRHGEFCFVLFCFVSLLAFCCVDVVKRVVVYNTILSIEYVLLCLFLHLEQNPSTPMALWNLSGPMFALGKPSFNTIVELNELGRREHELLKMVAEEAKQVEEPAALEKKKATFCSHYL